MCASLAASGRSLGSRSPSFMPQSGKQRTVVGMWPRISTSVCRLSTRIDCQMRSTLSGGPSSHCRKRPLS